jgi:hypothetical protein
MGQKVLQKLISFLLLLFFTGDGISLQNEKWNVPIIPLSEIKPGMTGTGKTVFYNFKIEEFGVQVIDIIKNMNPKSDVILVKLTGDMAEHAGVVSGMSGSPIYFNNRLAGALAYRFGQFMKEPIAGVTPIEAMLEIAHKESIRSQEMNAQASLTPDLLKVTLCGASNDFWTNTIAQCAGTALNGAGSIVPIHSPLVLAGFQEQLISECKNVFEAAGFVVMPGGTSATDTGSSPLPFEPGAAIAQVFVSGDMSVEATGTVTAVDNNRLLAFGHPLFNVGPVYLPMAHTKILTTLASAMASSKMAMATEIAGSVRQDRQTGIYGDMSLQPRMIPVTVSVNSIANESRSFHFKVANDPSLNIILPFYFRIALMQALTAARLATDRISFTLAGQIELDDGRIISIDDFFSSKKTFGVFEPGNEAASLSDLVASVLGILMVNDFKHPDIRKINVAVQSSPGEKVADIRSIRLDKTEIIPGDSIRLNIELKSNSNQKIHFVRVIRIPKNCKSDRLMVLASSALPVTQYEMQRNREKYMPVTFEHLLSILEKRRKNNNLYIQVRGQDSGLLLKGEELSSLPPSVLAVMDSRRSSGENALLAEQVIVEDIVPTEFQITGVKRLYLKVKNPQKPGMPQEAYEETIEYE